MQNWSNLCQHSPCKLLQAKIMLLSTVYCAKVFKDRAGEVFLAQNLKTNDLCDVIGFIIHH